MNFSEAIEGPRRESSSKYIPICHNSSINTYVWLQRPVFEQIWEISSNFLARNIFDGKSINKRPTIVGTNHLQFFFMDLLIILMQADDFANALIEAINKPDSIGNTYELGGPDILTIRQLIENIIFPDAMRDPMSIIPVPAKVAKLIGSIVGQNRSPVWIKDDVEFYSRDKVVSPNLPGLHDLGIHSPNSIVDHALGVLRAYRPSTRVTI